MALADVLHSLAEATDTAGLAHRTCRCTRLLLGVDGVSFVLSEGERVHYADEDAVGPLWKGRRFDASQSISGWVMHHRAATVVEDVFADPRILVDAYRPTFVKSLAALPLGWDDPLGALGVYWAQPHRATRRELFLLGRIAQSAHLALRCCRARAAADMDGANGGLRVLAMVAHDLRTPLAAVSNTTETLARNAVAGSEGEMQAALTRIRRSTAHATHLVNHLMHYAKLQREGWPLSVHTARLDEVCAAAADEVRAAYPQHSIQVCTEPAPGVWDAQRLTDAIGNLIRNAVEHGAGGVVEVRVVNAAEDDCRIEVHNDGPPIPSDCMPHLFEAFRQGSGGSCGSLGLGLHISDQIVRAHGGAIEVESGEELGTVFRVRLPRHASGPGASTEASHPPPPLDVRAPQQVG
ncbi:GAF domain-containing sensor histidine kinase [Ectothiorhodospiraceae bacterium 2226]|nr:GAF domain-containing sensor histidine kinase [Ectothiorhodospiraceae bacterium 2226]